MTSSLRFIVRFAVLVCLSCKPACAVQVTFLTYGFDTGIGRVASTKHTAAGLEVAIRQFREFREYFADLNITCDHVVLDIPNSFECTEPAADFDMVAQFYYSRKWDADRMLVMITPGCGDSVVLGGLAREWDVFIATTAFMYTETRNRLDYPTFVTVTPLQIGLLGETLLALFDQYNWTSVALIYDSATLPSYYGLPDTLKTQNIAAGSPVQFGSIAFQSTGIYSTSAILRAARTFARVIVLSMHVREVRKFLIAAKRLNMTNGGYVYLTTESTPGFASGTLTWQAFDEHDKDMFEAYRSMLQVSACERSYAKKYDALLQEMVDVAVNVYNVTYMPTDPQPSEVEVAAYQAFFIYLQVLHEIRQANALDVSGDAVAGRMLGRAFDSVFGDQLFIDQGGQRRSKQCVNDLNLTSGVFENVVYYDPKSRRLVGLPSSHIEWGTPDGQPPPNEPRCGFMGLRPECLRSNIATTTTAIVVPCTLIVLAAIIGVSAWRIAREAALRSSRWILDPAYLVPASEKALSGLSHGISQKVNQSMRREKPTHLYHDVPVTVKEYAVKRGKNPLQRRRDKKVLLEMSEIRHDNIVHFGGTCFAQGTLYLVSSFCPRGMLRTFLDESPSATDWDLRCSLINDCLEAVKYIHGSALKRHGNINCTTCLIDLRFTLLIAELGYGDLVNERSGITSTVSDNSWIKTPNATASILFEFTQAKAIQAMTPVPEQPDDIFAVGNLMEELLLSFQHSGTMEVTKLPRVELAKERLKPLVNLCSSEDPKRRPAIRLLQNQYRSICRLTNDGILVNLLQRLQTYAAQLEKQVHDRTVALAKERALCEDLLLEVLPKWVLDQMSTGLQIVPESFPSTTIFFSHISGFLRFAARHHPLETFTFISSLFLQFDKVVSNFLVFKVETVEDTYLVVSGIYNTTEQHTAEICRMALALHSVFQKVKGTHALEFMGGIHSGPCVAGVVGHKSPRYCLFGDSVNVASRMCTHSEPSLIHVSMDSANNIKDQYEFVLEPRGLTHLKGRGKLETFWLFPAVAPSEALP